MTFYSIDKLLNVILAQPQWEKQRKYHELTKCWYQVVNHKIAQHTRPISLNNEVLYIATASSSWAQDLNLQRRSLILKINRRIDFTVKDLHFATVKWYQNNSLNLDRSDNSDSHPSTIISDSTLNLLPPENPQEALQTWFNIIKKREQKFVTCPVCNINCPEGELKRWGYCAICFQKETSDNN
ncbi:DUF721 domain-containing protein [Geminocystis herdmanii]|uniref:DUF721 domain-containing protein n=1 Tax=Geminocystis herdmanii TaxID=669359 RepID=UPI000349102B|nr:DUF721 domain-containing protein [Geminocystis herdmanii]